VQPSSALCTNEGHTGLRPEYVDAGPHVLRSWLRGRENVRRQWGVSTSTSVSAAGDPENVAAAAPTAGALSATAPTATALSATAPTATALSATAPTAAALTASPAAPTAADVISALAARADAADALVLQRFFKTAPGEYGEGDVFVGVRVPAVRATLRQLGPLPLEAISELLDSPVHEHRLAALLALDARFARASAPRTRDEAERERLAAFYLEKVRAGRVDNWDLVDASAEFVLGEWLLGRPRTVLDELAASDDLWRRRVAVIATFAFLKHGDASTTLALASAVLDTGDRRDLTQKAVGWMLREVGKRVDPALLIGFLDANAPRMPATMLSYATEHLSSDARAGYRAARRGR
jgi:3-methyladenine DNA glycosylase AlkD